MKKSTGKGVVIGIAAFALLLVVIAISYFSIPSVDTVEAINSEYINKMKFEGLYFTQEFVIKGAETGFENSKLKAKEGERIPRGYLIYDGINSTEAGILGTHIDGYENKFKIDTVFKTSKKDLENMNGQPKPGLKIYNNSRWYVYVAVDKSETLSKYKSYEITFNNGSYPGDVVMAEEKSDANYYLFRIKNDLDIINLHRNINGYIIKSTYNGIVIPLMALTSKDGKTGVLIKANGYAEFRKASLIFEDKKNAIAVIAPEKTGRKLSQYDEIITNPEGMLDGAKIR